MGVAEQAVLCKAEQIRHSLHTLLEPGYSAPPYSQRKVTSPPGPCWAPLSKVKGQMDHPAARVKGGRDTDMPNCEKAGLPWQLLSLVSSL